MGRRWKFHVPEPNLLDPDLQRERVHPGYLGSVQSRQVEVSQLHKPKTRGKAPMRKSFLPHLALVLSLFSCIQVWCLPILRSSIEAPSDNHSSLEDMALILDFLVKSSKKHEQVLARMTSWSQNPTERTEVPVDPIDAEAPLPEEGLLVATVSAGSANLRTGPGETFSIRRSVPKDTLLPVESEENGWAKVIGPDGSRGWIARKLTNLR